ncbi:DUF3168 domain-containing protein [Leisingera daeponensis]|uniref:DUF3168 domain-containing protein n=1 Tax=Leisingera daeponensis TaxID=405746 RepID=A0ABS7NCA1_9RHOB|nr:DUF3168 domain-containing protein [Leisingera daeponensis]MBY6138472.1 DUF3168 domain-containing protein [Leisingera daeponensis]
MTYAIAGGLQSAVYTHLIGDAALAALVGSAIYDAIPAGPLPQTYVALGSEEVLDRSDKTAGGAEHRFFVTVTTDTAGFAGAKAAAAAVCDALEGASVPLPRGQLTGLWFDRAKAERLSSGGRQITLRFRARVDDA